MKYIFICLLAFLAIGCAQETDIPQTQQPQESPPLVAETGVEEVDNVVDDSSEITSLESDLDDESIETLADDLENLDW